MAARDVRFEHDHSIGVGLAEKVSPRVPLTRDRKVVPNFWPAMGWVAEGFLGLVPSGTVHCRSDASASLSNLAKARAQSMSLSCTRCT